MEKRTFLAVLLSILVLVWWQAAVIRPKLIENHTEQNTQKSPVLAVPDRTPQGHFPDLSLPSLTKQEKLLDLDSPKVKFTLMNPGANISKVYVKDFNLEYNLYKSFDLADFSHITFAYQFVSGKHNFYASQIGHFVTKTLEMSNLNYGINLSVSYANKTESLWQVNDKITLNAIDIKNLTTDDQRLTEIIIVTPSKSVIRKNLQQIKNGNVQSEAVDFISVRYKYGCIIMQPLENKGNVKYFIERNNGIISVGFITNDLSIDANSQKTRNFLVYCGPQEISSLKLFNQGFEEIVHFGMFDFISQILLFVMRFFYRLLHNWGIAIILLSVFVFLLIYPLSLKQMQSMKQTQMLQPQIEALRKTYKDNPQKLNKEVMDLYKKYKINPLGGCLPMLLQLPIFFGLYQALYRSVELKNARFLWIGDLAEPDRLFKLNFSLPFLGNEINLLPILMGIGMFLQQRISLSVTPMAASGSEQQRLMLFLFPVIFIAIFYHFPSGLSLYWFINTLLSVTQQWKTATATKTIIETK